MPSQGAYQPDIPRQLQLALNYAEESSKRVRWIVFLLQLAVLLVIYSVWQQHEKNWAQSRLKLAQDAITMLTCHPETIYHNSLNNNQALTELTNRMTNPGKTLTREELDDALVCKELDERNKAQLNAITDVTLKAKMITVESEHQRREEKKLDKYLESYNFSLTQVKANLLDLRRLRNNRTLGVGVPILGIIFDVNDLSIIAAITFSIILSWLYFALRREGKNINKVFKIAKESGGEVLIETADDLLKMTQVLTIPPGVDPDSRNISPLRRWSRVPTLIIGTAVFAQIVTLLDDFQTIKTGERLSIFVTHAETAAAAYLLVYIVSLLSKLAFSEFS